MKQDVINWSKGLAVGKRVSKESLNHRGIIEKVSGLDVYKDSRQAYLRAYEALGIDIINRVPTENAPRATAKGDEYQHPSKPYVFTNLGVYDTAFRMGFEVSSEGEVFSLEMDKLKYEDMLVPVPHSCRKDDIQKRQQVLGDIGLYYPMLYTTLFMWPVETLGWENFMLSAMTEPGKFHDYFLKPCAIKSRNIVDVISGASESPFVFLHDDLADANGPIFPLGWYEDYIFPHYAKIFEPAKLRGKKIIFVADGNMAKFLPRLIELGVDGIMCENPATALDVAIDHFGVKGKFLIGGIRTVELSISGPDEIWKMVEEVAEKTRGCPGFAMSSCGGLHGEISMANIEAYFDARAEIGVTPKNWRNYFA